MAYLSDIIERMEKGSLSHEEAGEIAAELLAIGADAAVERPETLFHAIRRYRRKVERYLAQTTWAAQ